MPDGTMPRRARAVVVGAGIAGCSVAYHLTQLGWRDIVVADQGPLFETGGSTSHAPGLVFQINPSKTMTSFARYTVDLWSRLELDGVPCAKTVGSLEVAWTPERLSDLKRKAGHGRSWGVEAHILSTAEARDLFPMLSERALGAIYVPSDIHTKATRPAEAMSQERPSVTERLSTAMSRSPVSISPTVVSPQSKPPRATSRPDLVVSAAGIWASRLGDMVGTPIPLSPMQHIYAVTTPLAELAGATEEISMPFLAPPRTHPCTSARWVTPWASAHTATNPCLWNRVTSSTSRKLPIAPAEMSFTPTHFEAAMTAAREVVPGTQGAGLTRKFNGLFSFTTDSFPVLGESPQVRGFWSAQAVWITHAAGIGRAVAEWIVNGEPTTDLRECDIRRFHPHALSRPYVRARSAQQYREVYDIIHPRQQMASPRNIRLTPFFARQQELGAVFFENAGWERPQWYDANQHLVEALPVTGESRSGWAAQEWSPTVAAEHAATRERVAMFDLTPFAQFEVTGPGALDALQRLASNQMNKPVGSITYTSMLTTAGGIKCDLTITRLGEERFLVVTGGAMGLHDLRLDTVAPAGRPLGERGRRLVGTMLHRPMGTEGARPAQQRLRGRRQQRRIPVYDRETDNHR